MAEQNQDKVRVSIANLAWYAFNRGILHPFAILNPAKLKQGKRQYAALGGGAMLTKRGKEFLEDSFGASEFEFDEKTGFFDARFVVDRTCLEPVFGFFTYVAGKSNQYEHDPTLDILAELYGKEAGYEQSILPESRGGSVSLQYYNVVRQKPAAVGTDTSARASSEIPTVRLFRIYALYMDIPTFTLFEGSPMVKFLTKQELATTNEGSTAGVASDGTPIQNNLFLA